MLEKARGNLRLCGLSNLRLVHAVRPQTDSAGSQHPRADYRRRNLTASQIVDRCRGGGFQSSRCAFAGSWRRGGRMIVPVGSGDQALCHQSRRAPSGFTGKMAFEPCVFVPLRGGKQ